MREYHVTPLCAVVSIVVNGITAKNAKEHEVRAYLGNDASFWKTKNAALHFVLTTPSAISHSTDSVTASSEE
jgi:hypothetical protein